MARSLSVPKDNFNDWRWLPLLTPAVKKNTCEIDYDLITQRVHRIHRIAMAALVILLSIMLSPIVFPMAVKIIPLVRLLAITVVPLGFLAPLLDPWIAGRAVGRKAVDEYLGEAPPSKSATLHIQRNLKAAELLIARNGDPNRINEDRGALLDHCSKLDVFKLLINNGADIKGVNKFGTSYFQKAVESRNPACLEYVLKQGKAAPSDFDATEQVQFWKNLGSIRAGHLLSEYGFDVNIKDKDEYTPLLRLVQAASKVYYRGNIGIQAHISTLLACGADRSITINDKGVKKNAMEIANPEIREILEG